MQGTIVEIKHGFEIVPDDESQVRIYIRRGELCLLYKIEERIGYRAHEPECRLRLIAAKGSGHTAYAESLAWLESLNPTNVDDQD